MSPHQGTPNCVALHLQSVEDSKTMKDTFNWLLSAREHCWCLRFLRTTYGQEL
jgi:hypothetical protein